AASAAVSEMIVMGSGYTLKRRGEKGGRAGLLAVRGRTITVRAYLCAWLAQEGDRARRRSAPLFCAPPSFHLTLGRDRIRDAVEFLVKDKFDGAPQRSEPIEGSGVVLGYARLQRISRRADIIGAVSTAQNIKICRHACRGAR